MSLVYWCASTFLFGLGIFILVVALLRSGNHRIKNKRMAEIEWQSRQSNTDWWLDINKKDRTN